MPHYYKVIAVLQRLLVYFLKIKKDLIYPVLGFCLYIRNNHYVYKLAYYIF